MSDEFGPEHLQIHTADPLATLPKLRNYGSVFLGEYASYLAACLSVGRRGSDYVVGVRIGGEFTILSMTFVVPSAVPGIFLSRLHGPV